jgi:hypothetical protein
MRGDPALACPPISSRILDDFQFGNPILHRFVAPIFRMFEEEILKQLDSPRIIASFLVTDGASELGGGPPGVIGKVGDISVGQLDSEFVSKRHIRNIGEKITDPGGHRECGIIRAEKIIGPQDTLSTEYQIDTRQQEKQK